MRVKDPYYLILVFHLLNLCQLINGHNFAFTKNELIQKKSEVKELIDFALDSYLAYGYPYDEVRPISCKPKTRNFKDDTDINSNDVLGNFTTTLVDSLSTAAILGDKHRFRQLIDLVNITYSPNKYTFESDATIQVFETTIRIIGGLLSAHLYATDPRKEVFLGEDYPTPFLLLLARDMADRLLPAYLTDTGLPLPRINLLSGTKKIPKGLNDENNVAGITSPMFEFTLLSYLTGDQKYEKVTRYAFDKIWQSRTSLDLLPLSINPNNGRMFLSCTGTGASTDSFFEYALKGSVLFDDSDLYDIWDKSYSALKVNSKKEWMYTNVFSKSGFLYESWIDSLSAFFPGLQVLDGDIEDSTKKHLLFMKLWNTFGGIPERWNFQHFGNKKSKRGFEEELSLKWYLLRPEFIESTYFLYRATKDPFYLNIGYNILHDLQHKYRKHCGFAGIQNLFTGEFQDRMETFVISETLTYLYLLFDEDNEIHHSRDNVIFSTEAHPVWLTTDIIRNYKLHGYFNDTVYIDHLNDCMLNDDITKMAPINEREFQLAFKRSNNNAMPLQSTVGACPNRDNLNLRSSSRKFLFSPLLSEDRTLFEIEHTYPDSLKQSDYLMKHTRQMEIVPEFYDQWADPLKSHSNLRSTTEIFELILDFEDDFVPAQLNKTERHKEVYNFMDLSGRHKFRIEKLMPFYVDSFGTRILPSIFKEFDGSDVHNIGCPGNDEGNTIFNTIYRIVEMDGMDVHDSTIAMSKKDIMMRYAAPAGHQVRPEDTAIGYNRQSQLMLGCVPVTNWLLQ